MRFLLLDNYDSFTYNLVHYLEPHGEVCVCLNDQELPPDWLEYDALVISPGPGLPAESGHLMRTLGEALGKVPVLGICLGHQAICSLLGGQLVNLHQVRHGVTTQLTAEPESLLFAGLSATQTVGLYHSWAVDPDSLPGVLRATAWSEEGILMAIEHTHLPVFGVQFHPESVMTPAGKSIIGNFVNQLAKNRQSPSASPA